MSRSARIVIPGLPHHVVQRGNNRQPVFLNPSDYEEYLRGVAVVSRRYQLNVHAYCLMDNHVHLVVTPGEAASLAQGLRILQSRYAQRFNQRYERTGHLWHERFYSCVLDEAHLWAALRYVENNPVRAGVVAQAWDYEWSSAAAHIARQDPWGLLAMAGWTELTDGVDWRKELLAVRPIETELLRTHTRYGRPLGREGFLAEVERILGRALPFASPGRPRE